MVKPLAQTKAKEAHDIYVRLIATKQHIEGHFYDVGEMLYEIRHRYYWRDLGHYSFKAFIADPYVNISPRNAYRLIRVHRTYIIEILLPQIAAIENEYWPEPLPPEAQTKLDELEGRFREDMSKAGSTKLEAAASYITGENYTPLINSAITQSRTDFTAHLTGREPVIRDWRSQLREARQLARALSQNANVPQEVQEFSLDYWRQTDAYE